jgi:hypothetical protein
MDIYKEVQLVCKLRGASLAPPLYLISKLKGWLPNNAE